MNNTDHKPFSVRNGYEQLKSIQHKSMDDDLRNGLWNVFYECFTKIQSRFEQNFLREILKLIWLKFLKRPIDQYENDSALHDVKNIFLKSEWYKAFDLFEFIIKEIPGLAIDYKDTKNLYKFIDKCNSMLEEENSAYRIIHKLVTEITSEHEIESIETAMATPYQSANNHIKNALILLSRRENPDYKNSIKESISAVESITKEITGNKSFANGVNELEKHNIKLHPVHQTALKNLYGFTSDADGIRHASVKDKSLDINQNTARFMLITCSAFVNYIVAEDPKNSKNL